MHSQPIQNATNGRIPRQQVAETRSITTVHALTTVSMPPCPLLATPRASNFNTLQANTEYANVMSNLTNNQAYGFRSMPTPITVNNMTSNFPAHHYPSRVMYSPLVNPQVYAVHLPPAAQPGTSIHAAFPSPQYQGHININIAPASGYGSNMLSSSPLFHPFTVQGCEYLLNPRILALSNKYKLYLPGLLKLWALIQLPLPTGFISLPTLSHNAQSWLLLELRSHLSRFPDILCRQIWLFLDVLWFFKDWAAWLPL